jgi:hypothetical protein
VFYLPLFTRIYNILAKCMFILHCKDDISPLIYIL